MWWFQQKNIIVNSGEFQTIALERKGVQGPYKLIIQHNETETINFLKLLVMDIDNLSKFNEHISIICSKATTQLNVLSRFLNYIQKPEKTRIIQKCIFWIWIIVQFNSRNSKWKTKNIQRRWLWNILSQKNAGVMIIHIKSYHGNKNYTTSCRNI